MKTDMKFQNLQISGSLNINPNKFSRLKFQPFKIMHISWRYNSAVSRFGYLYWVNQIFSLTNAFVFFINWWCFSEVWKKKDSSLLSKSTVKFLVFCQVFWVKLQGLLDQRISVWALAFYYCISKNLPWEKTIIQMQKCKWSFSKYVC